MAFTPTNFLEAENALDVIAQEARQSRNIMDQGIKQLELAATRLTDMQANWGNAVTFIDDQAVAFPADEQWTTLKERKDKMVTDFLAMRDKAIAVRNAAKSV